MTNHEFRAIRNRLGLTQAQLARVLRMAFAVNVSAWERESNPRPIPTHIELLMTAYDEGYRPKDWPQV